MWWFQGVLDLVRRYPKFQGGFIWDFADQGIRGKYINDKPTYLYGGDFNEYDPSDNNFCNNGLFNPDRVPNPHLHEVAHQYQNIWVDSLDKKNGTLYVYNENFFKDLSDQRMEWQLIADGEKVMAGFDTLALPAGLYIVKAVKNGASKTVKALVR